MSNTERIASNIIVKDTHENHETHETHETHENHETHETHETHELHFNNIIHTWKTYIETNLLPIVKKQNVEIEGNLYTSHHSFIENNNLDDKRHNIYNLLNTISPEPTNILEIGFNAGFSCLLMKLIKPDLTITCIDINEHRYVVPCYNKLTEDFNNINLEIGSSHNDILFNLVHACNYSLNNNDQTNINYDIIHIDGDHSYNGAIRDLNLCLQLSRPGTIIIFDDTNFKHINNICDKYIALGKVCEYKPSTSNTLVYTFKNTQKYKHRFLQVMPYQPPIYISMTSIFSRQYILFTTLTTLLQQSTKPDAIFLYLSEKPYLLDTGFTNKKITNRKLANLLKSNRDNIYISWVENIGPYRKLLPLLKEKWTEDCFIITVDDDVMYSPELVKELVNNYNKNKCVVGYRGRTPHNNDLAKFNYKKYKTKLTNLSLYNFTTGRGSILYKPSFFYKTHDLIFDANIYLSTCPTADDIWFHLIRIKNNISCYIITTSSYQTKYIDTIGLYKHYNLIENNTTFHNTLSKINTILPP